MSWNWTAALVGLQVLICAVSYFAANRAAEKETASAPTAADEMSGGEATPLKEMRPSLQDDDPMTEFIKADIENPGSAELPPEVLRSAKAWSSQLKAWQKAQGFEESGKRDKRELPYDGPQTAEALMAAFDARWRRINTHRANDPLYSPENTKALLERALERGAVVKDYGDYIEFTQVLRRNIEDFRVRDKLREEITINMPPRMKDRYSTARESLGLPESATWEEVDDAAIDRKIRTWPTLKMWMDMCFESKEPIVRVNLDPKSGATFYLGELGKANLSDEQEYLITHYGVVPEGVKIFYVDDDDNVLPPEEVQFYNYDDRIAKLTDRGWKGAMRRLENWTPAVAEEEEWDTVKWMVFLDYSAALLRAIEKGERSWPTRPSTPPPSGAAPGRDASGSASSADAPAAPSQEPVGPSDPGVHEAPPPPPRRPFETREEQTAAYEMIMDAFIESNPQLDPETRELIKRQQDAYQLWLEMRPRSEPPVEKRR